MEPEQRLKLLLSEGKNTPHDVGLKHQSEKEKREEEEEERLMKAGAQYFHRHFFSMFVCMLTGLLCLMYIPSIVSVLHFTGKSNSPILAFKRYLATLKHSITWYNGPHSLRKSLTIVKGQHKSADTRSRSQGLAGISQYDMVITQWAFLAPALLWPRKLGLPDTGEEEGVHGLVVILREVGAQLGVKEEYNLCKDGDVDQTRDYCRLLMEKEILPSVKSPSVLAQEMASHLLAGVSILNPFIQPEAFHAWANSLLGSDTTQVRLNSISKLLYNLQDLVLGYWMHVPVIGFSLRTIANLLMRLNIHLASYWEELIVHRVQSGPCLPWGLHTIEPFVFIPFLTCYSLCPANLPKFPTLTALLLTTLTLVTTYYKAT